MKTKKKIALKSAALLTSVLVGVTGFASTAHAAAPKGALKGIVYIDKNKDGKYEATKDKVRPKATVKLFKKVGTYKWTLLYKSTTDAKGNYATPRVIDSASATYELEVIIGTSGYASVFKGKVNVITILNVKT